MTVKALLNTDIAVLGDGLSRFWLWWLGQLRALLPESLRGLSGGTRLVTSFEGNVLVLREFRRKEGLHAVRRYPSGLLVAKSHFALPPEAILIREAVYPPLPMADLRRLIALDIDRLTPFREGDVVFDIEVRPGTHPCVMVGVMRRSVLEETLASLRMLGGEPRTLGLIDGRNGTVRFDFLKVAHLRGRRPLLGLRPGWWWVAAGALFAANLALLVARDISSVAGLRDAVDAQRSSVVLANSLRRRVDLEARRRSAVEDSLRRASPLAVLDAVTRALPDSMWVRRLEWNGKAIHLAGSAPAGLDVAALLKSLPLAPGSARIGSIHAAPTQAAPFDVTVDLKEPP